MPKHPNWLEVDVVQEHYRRALKEILASVEIEFSSRVDGEMGSRAYLPLESPLEAIFVLWNQALSRIDYGRSSEDYDLACQREVTAGGENFRLDFVITPSKLAIARRAELPDYKFPLIAVEVDGHAFHEKTREQVAYRNTRDRLLQQDGWHVFHYSWSELTSDPLTCVREVIDYADKRYAEFNAAYWRQRWSSSNEGQES